LVISIQGGKLKTYMSRDTLILVFFCYGLAFFSMGQIVALESRGGSDERLRHALRPPPAILLNSLGIGFRH